MEPAFWKLEDQIFSTYDHKIESTEDFGYILGIKHLSGKKIEISSYLNNEKSLKEFIEGLPNVRVGMKRYNVLTVWIKTKKGVRKAFDFFFKKYDFQPFDEIIHQDKDGILEKAILHYKFYEEHKL